MMGNVPPVEAGVRGSGASSGKVVSRRWSAAVDFAFEEDAGDSSISWRLHRKRNIDPLFSESHVVIEITDTNNPQAVEAAGLRRPGKPSVVGTYSFPPSVLGDTPSVVVCVAAGIEKGKQVVRAWLNGSSPGSSDPDAAAQSVGAMHAAIKAFGETYFASYLRLGELDLDNLRQMCSEEEEHVSDGSTGGTASTQPRQG
ncbi:unnamed protein product [Lactuca virosa]|uniref:Uncharacterized protein n=1 Tax=Lactuca virosa TaxID=75947 RepID=A0AAU9MBM7_9ASTR|nr:unnamed protein product [Lactuca virosa]